MLSKHGTCPSGCLPEMRSGCARICFMCPVSKGSTFSASDRRWQKLVEYGNGQAQKLGIKEEDVDRLIHEWRAEQRGR